MRFPRGTHFPTPPPLGDDFLRCGAAAAARSLPQHALTWTFNPSAAAPTDSPTPVRVPSGLCLTPPPPPRLFRSAQKVFSFLLHGSFYSVFVRRFSGAAPRSPTPPSLSFLLEVSTMSNGRLGGLFTLPPVQE